MAKTPSLLPAIIDEAVNREAADVILSFGCVPVLKVDGTLIRLDAFGVLSDHDLNTLVDEVLPQSRLEELKKERQVDFAYAHKNARFRVNIFYQRGHVSVVLRYVREVIRSIEELGLPDLVKELVGNDNGLVLLVGPTGSGKSTSLAAMVDYVNENFEKHIITIEDPVEYIYTNKKSLVEQREIGLDATSFASALRSALREAPDVILLGEMRDLESISSAITVAETGHLVLSTIHANSAPGTIDRIVDVFPAEQKDQVRIQLADVLLGVINQRLVPKADGNGSTLVLEVMLATPAVRNAIRTSNSAQLPNVIQTSAADGMVLLDDALQRAVRKGVISKENALSFANDREALKKELN